MLSILSGCGSEERGRAKGLGQPLKGCRKTLQHIPGTKFEVGNHEYAAYTVIIITN